MFTYTNCTLYCENVALADIARSAGTPCYVYSSRTITENFEAYESGFAGLDHLVCYAAKANSSLAVLSLLARLGSGFDIVSGGELFRVLKAGGDPSRVVFSGVGKTVGEVDYALESRIHSFNCESESEIALIDALAARRGIRASISVRVNPDVDPGTHPYIATGMSENKFGIDIGEIEEVYERAKALRNVQPAGVSCHIGSQLLDIDPMMEAVERMLDLVERLRARGHEIRHLDLGGGLGVAYKAADRAPDIQAFIEQVRRRVAAARVTIMVEPGRSITGPAGVLITRVLYRKRTPRKEFIVVDAAMNDLIRPSLYQSHHDIVPLRKTAHGTVVADVVGPICETGDFLARDREIANVVPGDLLAVSTAGAYGFVLASNYNSRPRPPEVLVEGDSWRIIRARETYDDLIRGEEV